MELSVTNIFIVINTALTIVLASDALMWNIVMIRHAVWMRKFPEEEKRKTVSSLRIIVSCWFNIPLIMMLTSYWMLAVYLWLNHGIPQYRFYVLGFAIFCVYLCLIHMYAIIARFCTIPKRYWPCMSHYVSKILATNFNLRHYPE